MKTRLPRKFKLWPLLLTAVVVGGVGAYFVFFSHAETSNNIYRLVNASGVHIISTDTNEKNSFVNSGWKLELTRTYAVVSNAGTTPFNRLHNTTNHVWALAGPTQTSNLVADGWVNQGTKFNSVKGYAGAAPYGFCRVPWFKLTRNNDRLYTPDTSEVNKYVSQYGYTKEDNDLFELFMACSTNPDPGTIPSNPGTGGGNSGGGSPSGGSSGSGTGSPTTGTGSSGSTQTNTTSTTKPKPAPAPTAPVVSTSTDATVTAGTKSAKFSIPAGGAQSVKVVYGTSADKLDKSSEPQTVKGSDVSILIKDLDPLATYSYQVQRTTNGQTKSSATATFKTTGYDLVLYFVNNDQSPVANVTGKIQTPEQEATSDETGTMRFSDVPAGSYSVEYSYNDQNYTETLDTANPSNTDGVDAAAVLYASNTIDVSSLGKNNDQAAAKPKKSSKVPLVLGILFLLGLIAGAAIFIRRRRATADYYEEPQVYVAPPTPAEASDPNLHVGESLRDMVIKSMREEAARKQQHETKESPKEPKE